MTLHVMALGQKTSGSVIVELCAFLASLSGNALIDYFGFYSGSVDNYNDFEFFDSSTGTSQKLCGTDLLAQFNESPGNRDDPSANTYFNITLSNDFAFDKVKVSSDGRAGEFDNIVNGLTTRAVPEPTSLAIFGLGLIAMSLSRGKRSF